MRTLSVVIACMMTGAGSLASADPPASTTGTAPAAPPAATASAGASASPSVAPGTTVTAPAPVEADDRLLRNLGYKSEMRNGRKVWCKTEETLGTRVADKKVCALADSVLELNRNSREMVEYAQRIKPNPNNLPVHGQQ